MDDRALIKLLKALANATRFRMVQQVASARELSCGQLGDLFDLSQPTVSHHMKILADAGIFKVRRDGQHARLSVDHALVDDALARLPIQLHTPRPRTASKLRR